MIVNVLVGLVALIHTGVLIVEICFWRQPAIHRQLAFNQEQADKAAPIVYNMGLYNGFLAAGLCWSFFRGEDVVAVRTFFLTCIVVAGLFGALTLRPRTPATLLLQTIPAAVALAAVWLVRAAV